MGGFSWIPREGKGRDLSDGNNSGDSKDGKKYIQGYPLGRPKETRSTTHIRYWDLPQRVHK